MKKLDSLSNLSCGCCLRDGSWFYCGLHYSAPELLEALDEVYEFYKDMVILDDADIDGHNRIMDKIAFLTYKAKGG